ncbi:putative ATP-dependent DEAD/H RNA helicase [Trypanosoma vivax]|nr:putative ATP-dependent DEAD/H RNA helicase [Trypanosoma vivax]
MGPQVYSGPTGDVDTAFVNMVQSRLLSSSSTTISVPDAVRASPIYRAVMRYALVDDCGTKEPKVFREQCGNTTAMAATGIIGTHIPPSLARRGVAPRDPLTQRKLQRQQQQTKPSGKSHDYQNAISSGSSCVNLDESVVTIDHQRPLHWSGRPLRLMTEAGWDVFHEQVGIRLEVVVRRRGGGDAKNGDIGAHPAGLASATGRKCDESCSSSSGSKQQRGGWGVTDEHLCPIRCWEEARLPLSLGTVISRRFLLPSAIQAQCVPLIMAAVTPSSALPSASTSSGKIDVLGVAETGSGKTAAYLIPLLAGMLRDSPRLVMDGGGLKDMFASRGPLALVIVPTRELAEQVSLEAQRIICGIPAEEMEQLVKKEHNLCDLSCGLTEDSGNWHHQIQYNTLNEIRVVKVVGGEQADAQYDELVTGAHLVVGTVGQLEMLLSQRLLALGSVRMVVLDEADRMMLERQQREGLIAVLDRCPVPRQTVMFTATLSKQCEELAMKYFSPEGYVIVRVPERYSTITQAFEVVPCDASTTPSWVRDDHVVVGEKHVEGTKRRSSPEAQTPARDRRRHRLVHPVKFARLVNYLVYATPPVVVFVNEKRTCDALVEELRAEAAHLEESEGNFSLEGLVGDLPKVMHLDASAHRRRCAPNLANMRSVAVVHSEQSQTERKRLVACFRTGERRVLITTDLLARGLDVPSVSLVINYDLPLVDRTVLSSNSGQEAVQKYIHRIGRTGRAGANGLAVSFASLPSALVQRATQYITRNGGHEGSTSANDNFADGITAPVSESQRVGRPDANVRTYLDFRNRKREREEFVGPGDAWGSGEVLSMLRQSEDEDCRGGEEVRHHSHCARGSSRDENGLDDGDNSSFRSDEFLLGPLWSFLVSCAETNSDAPGSGANIIREKRCRLLQVPDVLAAIMYASAQGPSHGTISA